MEKIPVRHITSTLKEPALSGSFNIRDIGALLSGEDMVQQLHRHDFFFVLALEKGTGEHVIDFVSYTISDYAVFFMRPGQVHQLTLNKESTGYLMEFAPGFYTPHHQPAKQVLRKVSSKNHCQLSAGPFEKLFSILTYIFKEYTGRQDRYQEVIKANLEIFFIELLRQSRHPGSGANSGNYHTQECLEELLELLETHISTGKQVTCYADKMHLTPYQLNAITKETLGKTCSELITDYIILESKRHLLATTNLVNEIAWHLGYEDVSYFIRFFKKHTGYSPEVFRHNFR